MGASLSPLLACENEDCRKEIFVDDVFRSIIIPRQPGYVALSYKCRHCGLKGKAAAEATQWDEYQQEAEDVTEARVVAEAEIGVEVSHINDLGDLRALWSRKRPLIEKHRNGCQCRVCYERWNG